MNKKFVFIVPTVSAMGGAQMYIRNRMVYMQKQGWNVDVICTHGGEAAIPELRVFNNVIPELGFCTYLFSKKKQKSVCKQLLNYLNVSSQDEVLIESTCIPESSWAELVSKEIQAKHFIFILQEENKINNPQLIDFFRFKLQRKEIAGIVNSTLEDLFAPHGGISSEESFRLAAHCSNVEADIDYSLISKFDVRSYDNVVGLLSRLDKPFVIPTIQEFVQYALSNVNKTYFLILIGGAPNKQIIKDISRILSQIKNLKYIITGYLFPIPIKLLNLCDVFMTSAGSCNVCARSGIPTISIDGKDCQPIGIYKRTTENSLFRDKYEPVLALSYWLNRVLNKREFHKCNATYCLSEPDFTSHMEFVNSSSSSRIYYNMSSIHAVTQEDKKMKLWLFLLGAKNYFRISCLKKSILKR